MAVGPAVALHSHGPHIRQQDHGALPNRIVQPGSGQLLADNRISLAERRQTVRSNLSDNANAQSRARERLAGHNSAGQTELATHSTDLVLEQQTQRLYQRKFNVVGQTSHIVVALDIRRAATPAGLHHVRVQRTLHEEINTRPLRRIRQHTGNSALK